MCGCTWNELRNPTAWNFYDIYRLYVTQHLMKWPLEVAEKVWNTPAKRSPHCLSTRYLDWFEWSPVRKSSHTGLSFDWNVYKCLRYDRNLVKLMDFTNDIEVVGYASVILSEIETRFVRVIPVLAIQLSGRGTIGYFRDYYRTVRKRRCCSCFKRLT